MRLALCLSVALASSSLAMSGAQAQDAGRPAARGGSTKSNGAKRPPKVKRAKATKDREKTPVRTAGNDKGEGKAPDKVAADEPARSTGVAHAPLSEDAAALAAEADERVRKEGGSEIKTVEFGGLDIDGQLKTPQMLYFLNRLRAEFSRPELPHRSFMPELQRGTQENGF